MIGNGVFVENATENEKIRAHAKRIRSDATSKSFNMFMKRTVNLMYRDPSGDSAKALREEFDYITCIIAINAMYSDNFGSKVVSGLRARLVKAKVEMDLDRSKTTVKYTILDMVSAMVVKVLIKFRSCLERIIPSMKQIFETEWSHCGSHYCCDEVNERYVIF